MNDNCDSMGGLRIGSINHARVGFTERLRGKLPDHWMGFIDNV